MSGLLRHGAAIQVASGFCLFAQNLIGPHLMGAEAYGLAISVLIVPAILQGLIEAVVIPLAIRHTQEEGRGQVPLHSLKRDSVVVVACGIIAMTLLAVFGVIPASEPISMVLAMLGIAWFIASVVTTWAMAKTYATARFKRIFWMYSTVGITSPIFFFALSTYGGAGALMTFLISQILALLILILGVRGDQNDKSGIQAHQNVLSMRGQEVLATYGALVSPRLALLALVPGTTLIAALTLSPEAVAAYRVSLTIVIGCTFLIPISAPIWQILFSGTRIQDFFSNGRALVSFILLFIGVTFLSAALFVHGHHMVSYITGVSVSEAQNFSGVFLAIVPYLMISPLGSFLIARSCERGLYVGVFALVLAMALALVLNGLVMAFVIGSTVFVISVCLYLRLSERFGASGI